MKPKVKIPKGSLFLITSDEFCDFTVVCLAIALQDINLEKLKKTFPGEKRSYRFDVFEFTAWLLNESDLAKEVECIEFHTDDYGCIEFTLKPFSFSTARIPLPLLTRLKQFVFRKNRKNQ